MQIAPKHRALLDISLADSDQFCVYLRYIDSSGAVTERTVIPLTYLTESTLRVYCVCRQAVRTIKLSRVLGVKLRLSADVLAGDEQVRHLIQKFKRADKSTETGASSPAAIQPKAAVV